MGLGERDQVPNRPGDDHTFAVEISVTPLGGAKYLGDISCDGRFFGDNGSKLRGR